VAAAEEEVFMGAARWLAGGRRRVLEPLDAQQTAEMGGSQRMRTRAGCEWRRGMTGAV
jgi:hypothetical protein